MIQPLLFDDKMAKQNYKEKQKLICVINPTRDRFKALRPLRLMPLKQQERVNGIRRLVRRDHFFTQIPNQSPLQRPHIVTHPLSPTKK
jgi:hypothetical protein